MEAVLCFSAIINSANSKKPGNTVREWMASALKAGRPGASYPTTKEHTSSTVQLDKNYWCTNNGAKYKNYTGKSK